MALSTDLKEHQSTPAPTQRSRDSTIDKSTIIVSSSTQMKPNGTVIDYKIVYYKNGGDFKGAQEDDKKQADIEELIL